MLRVVETAAPRLSEPSPFWWGFAAVIVEIADKPKDVDRMCDRFARFVEMHGGLANVVNIRGTQANADTLRRNIECMKEFGAWLEAARPILRTMVEAKGK